MTYWAEHEPDGLRAARGICLGLVLGTACWLLVLGIGAALVWRLG